MSQSLLSLASHGLLYSLLALLAVALWKVYPFLVRAFNPSLKNLPGPPTASLLWGNLKAIQEEDNSVPQERWIEEYHSHTITYQGFLGVCSCTVHRRWARVDLGYAHRSNDCGRRTRVRSTTFSPTPRNTRSLARPAGTLLGFSGKVSVAGIEDVELTLICITTCRRLIRRR